MEEFLSYAVYAFYAIPVLIGLLRRERLSGDQRMLVAWCAFVIPFSLASEYVGQRYGSNLPLYHIYTFLEFSLLYYLFRRSVKRLPAAARIAPVLVLAGIGLWGLAEDPFSFPDRFRAVESVIMIGCAILFCFQALRDLDAERIERMFMFWFAVAVLLYFSGNLLLYAFSNYISEASDTVYFTVWTIHTLFNFLLYLLYAIALLCRDPTPQSSRSSS